MSYHNAKTRQPGRRWLVPPEVYTRGGYRVINAIKLPPSALKTTKRPLLHIISAKWLLQKIFQKLKRLVCSAVGFGCGNILRKHIDIFGTKV
jgi:hypothetical protein